MSLHHCFDAAFPPEVAPEHCDSVLGYLGPNPHATHVWTLQEWQRYAHLRQFPGWICNMAGDPVTQAKEAVHAAKILGWHNHRALIGDTETAVNREWWAKFAGEVTANGMVPVDYGSLSFVLQNAARILWVADWDHMPVLQPGQVIWADQYQSGKTIDLSVLSNELYLLGGEGKRV
jgi:hypothetical protein